MPRRHVGSLLLVGLACLTTASAAPAPRVESRLHRVPPPQSTCPAWPSGSGLLADGDFSQASDPGNVHTGIKKGNEFAPDWIARGPRTIDFYGTQNPLWQTPNNVCNVDLDGTPGPGGIEHAAFSTSKHATYTVTFELSGNGACEPTVKEMTVSVSHDQFQLFTWDTSSGQDAQNGVWSQESWRFRGVGNLTNLRFQSDDPKGNCGALVAAIAVAKT